MSKFVILEIGDIDNKQCYPVALRIGDSINSSIIESRGYLPPVTDFLKSYNNLQQSRSQCGFGSTRALQHINKGQITKTSVRKLATEVKENINTWLNSGDSLFRPVRDKLLQVLSAERASVRLMIQTDDVELWGWPWHLWDILDKDKIEPIFSRLTNSVSNNLRINPKDKVRILVILGENTDINVQADLEILKGVIQYNAEIEELTAIRSSQLNEQLWERNWDILFFAGHSSSKPTFSQGTLFLNEDENIPIEDLKRSLENAIKHGLKLAIFNSCDGMGLVRELASLQIPAVIAMRERVPDEVAQKFLE
ncbi:MAG TPA: CHAT domain-containing protein, partial [Kamptonema sp.]|nr:CHAT domain-containing protein [Kamptonema sp.]